VNKAKKMQKKLIENVASKKFKTVKAAALAAGYSPNTDISKAVMSAQRAYLNALEKAGATDKKSARVIAEAMDAKITRMVAVEGKKGEREVVTEEDHYARLKANEQYLKVKRLLDPEETPSAPNISVTIEILDENHTAPESGNRISQFIQV
jgi:hypothetical protein